MDVNSAFLSTGGFQPSARAVSGTVERTVERTECTEPTEYSDCAPRDTSEVRDACEARDGGRWPPAPGCMVDSCSGVRTGRLLACRRWRGKE